MIGDREFQPSPSIVQLIVKGGRITTYYQLSAASRQHIGELFVVIVTHFDAIDISGSSISRLGQIWRITIKKCRGGIPSFDYFRGRSTQNLDGAQPFNNLRHLFVDSGQEPRH